MASNPKKREGLIAVRNSLAQVQSIDRELGALSQQVSTLSKEFDEERKAADTHRRDLREVIGALSGAVRDLTKEIAEMKPLVIDYREHRAENRGAAAIKKWIFGTVVSIASVAGAIINEFWKHLTHVTWPK